MILVPPSSCMTDVLIAVGDDGVHRWELMDRVGWGITYCRASAQLLARAGMISKYELHGKWHLTESGKIARAIAIGKRARRAGIAHSQNLAA